MSTFLRGLNSWRVLMAQQRFFSLQQGPQHFQWTRAPDQNGGLYIPIRISDGNRYPAPNRFEKSIRRAINQINQAIYGCFWFKLVGINAQEYVRILDINVFHAGHISCYNGGAFSENFGYDPQQDNIIRINADAFTEFEDRVIDLMFMHEILHSVFNIRHEHTRLDRDQYIVPKIEHLMCNKPPLSNGYFDLDHEASMEFPYDLRSIMHTNWDDVSVGRMVNTVEVQPGIPPEWGIGPQKQGLSFFDILKMRKFYSCPVYLNTTHFEQERQPIYLWNWMVHCVQYSRPLPLTYTRTGDIRVDNSKLIDQCLEIVDRNQGLLANIDLDSRTCYVIFRLDKCEYRAHRAQNVAVIRKTHTVMRTIHDKIIGTPSDIVPVSTVRDPTYGTECQRLCQIMPTVCVAATVLNPSTDWQSCILYQWIDNSLIEWRDEPTAITYVAFDWAIWMRDGIYDSFIRS
ncbi:uncharacterized protein LOC129592902 isoform X2 [Paramacrobiotus metropolitanus]|nr:uncharacterized protein LOC129592902 isoform X2 [Paramacrobiotus metropolitanus]